MNDARQLGHWGRTIFIAACALAAMGALWQLHADWPHWLAVIAPAVLWPAGALWLERRSAYSDSNDVILAFGDGVLIGLWIALAHFNLLASAVMLLLLVHSAYALHSARHAVLGVAGAIAGLAASGLITLFAMHYPVGTPAVVGSLAGLAVYLAAQGIATARLLHTLARKEQMLTVLRRVDALTGFFGRAYWNDLAARLFHYAQQKDIAAFLLMVDVDNFRHINSSKGESAGDEVLIAVANTLRNCVRPGDATCRFGGDSFGVLLPDVNLDIANQIAERIHTQVRSRRLRDWPHLQISVSIGMARLARHHPSVDEWIAQAEASLDQARSEPRLPAQALEPISAEHLAELARGAVPAPGM